MCAGACGCDGKCGVVQELALMALLAFAGPRRGYCMLRLITGGHSTIQCVPLDHIAIHDCLCWVAAFS